MALPGDADKGGRDGLTWDKDVEWSVRGQHGSRQYGQVPSVTTLHCAGGGGTGCLASD